MPFKTLSPLMTDEPQRPKPELFASFHEATSVIQLEMSKVLVTHDEAKRRLEAQLKLPDAAQMETLQTAVHQFISFQPLAQMNGVNLISMVIACHSNLTGDDTLHQIFEQINQRALGLPEHDAESD